MLEVVVDYPHHLHDLNNDLPFLPEVIDGKLTLSLNDKRNYVVHIRTLDQTLSNGLVVCKFHRLIQFNQALWMKPYMDFNTAKRAKARNEFKKDYYKAMNFTVFGKTMENLGKHRNIKFTTDFGSLHKYESKPNWITTTMCDTDFAAVELAQTSITMNKPTYIGQTVLDISKLLSYEFHYDYMIPKYGDRANCVMITLILPFT